MSELSQLLVALIFKEIMSDHGELVKNINNTFNIFYQIIFLPLSLTIFLFSFTPLNSPYPYYLSQKKFGVLSSTGKMCNDPAFSCCML